MDDDDLPNELTIESNDSSFYAVLWPDGHCFFYDEENNFILSVVLGHAIRDSADIQAILPIVERFYDAGYRSGRFGPMPVY